MPPESVPEIYLGDVSLALSTGYAESKNLAEQLLLKSVTLIDVSIYRVGQIAGPTQNEKGVWKKDEWLPSLIKSSRYLQILPESLGESMTELDWIPIDLASTALVEVSLLPWAGSARVYHVVNPRTCSWKSLLSAVQETLNLENLTIVPFDEWVEALRNSAPGTFEKQEIEENPAIKLLELFQDLPRANLPKLDTTETQKRSRTLREIDPIKSEDMKR